MRVLICPDSYKGSASSEQVAVALAAGVRAAQPDARVVNLPIADGGEGSVSTVAGILGADIINCEVTGPYRERVSAAYAMVGESAYIEMAQASGLCLSARRECEYATSYGTGELILDAVRRGAREIVVFVGGSATCDGGIGMAEALGYCFLSAAGGVLDPVGRSMRDVARIIPPDVHPLSCVRVRCASDVTNLMYGESGAAFVFAPQKGADEATVRSLDEGLRNLACVVERDLGVSVHTLVGGGAAGGLGAGLCAFAFSSMCGGFDLIAEISSLESRICDSDVVITGEGCTDRQSAMGKAVGNIARLCQKHGKKCILVSGMVKDVDSLGSLGIYSCHQSSEYARSVEESIVNASKYISMAAECAMRELILK